jgi:hypothetical protein
VFTIFRVWFAAANGVFTIFRAWFKTAKKDQNIKKEAGCRSKVMAP